MSYLANHFHTPFFAYVAPLVAFIAIAKSFFGHYLGASEGLQGLISKLLRDRGKTASHTQLKCSIELFMVLTCWAIATLNPNILKMIETLSGPVIAIFLFLMPMYAIVKIPAMRKYKTTYSNIFVTITGVLALSAILYGIWSAIV